MFTIGEFSKITGLTVKTLRFYHEEQVLLPAHVDPDSGYRYYSDEQIAQARTIAQLRGMDLPLAEIRALVREGGEPQRLLAALERHRETLSQKIKDYRHAMRVLEKFLNEEKEAHIMAQSEHDVVEKQLAPLLVAGVRMKGRYSDCGKAFAQLGRQFGRYIGGAPFLLHYDSEYREDDAEFEACMPLKRAESASQITVRELAGGRCVSLVHIGPYDRLGLSYAKILAHVKTQGYVVSMPTREVYLKGPGMIFKGNPQKYITEIQLLVDEAPQPKAGD